MSRVPTRTLHRLLGALACAAALLAACTGLSFGENDAGQDTSLEGHDGDGVSDSVDGVAVCRFLGSIAVDPRTEVAYVLETTYAGACRSGGAAAGTSKRLLAVDPNGGGTARVVLDLAGTRDLRLLFAEDRLLVMAERDGHDVLIALDPASGAVLAERATEARYHGTRMSPSRRYVAVADNAQTPPPIHVIDTRTLEAVSVAHEGAWLEAMWLGQTDTLAAAIFSHGPTWAPEPDDAPDAPSPHARVVLWDVGPEAFAGAWEADGGAADALWSQPAIDVTIEGARMDLLFSFTWVGVAPDDRHIVVPVRFPAAASGAEHHLLVMDTLTGDVRQVVDARGPVGFTPDSASIVSYRYVETGQTADGKPATVAALLVLDAETLDEELHELPDVGLPSYFVTRAGNFVVVAAAFGGRDMVLVDLDHARQTRLEGLTAPLHEFVSRPAVAELWVVHRGLFRIDVLDGIWEAVDPGFVPDHVNRLPTSDLLVLDDPSAMRLVFFDPEAGAPLFGVDLPAAIAPGGAEPSS